MPVSSSSPPPVRPRVPPVPASPAPVGPFSPDRGGEERAPDRYHHGGSSETGRYLRRSWALIEQMRHAVEEQRRRG